MKFPWRRSYSQLTTSPRLSDPLRILYFGSDKFSCFSLGALHDLSQKRPDIIHSIDVVCRPPKLFGRGRKTLATAPVKAHAESLGLPVHFVDSFKQWRVPSPPGGPINLVIAVSFGLLIPRQVLLKAEYGGLNVHPSLLPEFRGAAPLHYTLLHSRTHTGVTLQTLHPHKLDQGKILLQTPPPGIPIPNPEESKVEDLIDLLAPVGASLLVKGIHEEVYLPSNHPRKGIYPSLDDERNKNLRMYPWAPKITKDDRHVDWRTWTADKILKRAHVLGPVWCVASTLKGNSGYSPPLQLESSSSGDDDRLGDFSKMMNPFKRFQMRSLSIIPSYDISRVGLKMVKEPGWAFLQNIQQENLDEEEGNTQLETNEDEDDKEEVLRIWTHDRKLLQIGEIKVEGEKWEDAVKAVRKAKMVDGLRKPVLVEELARRKGRRGLFEFDEDEERDGIGGGSEESGDGQVKQQQQKKEEQVWIIPFLDALQ